MRLNEDDRYTLRRYEDFRAAAEYVAAALAPEATVMRVALFGSVAATPELEYARRGRRVHEPKDVDVAVWLDGPTDLDRLRVRCGHAVQQLWRDKDVGVAHHQLDVFLLDARDKYLGRLCKFNRCPKHKAECSVEGCGAIPFLQQHENFPFSVIESLHPSRRQILYERR